MKKITEREEYTENRKGKRLRDKGKKEDKDKKGKCNKRERVKSKEEKGIGIKN